MDDHVEALGIALMFILGTMSLFSLSMIWAFVVGPWIFLSVPIFWVILTGIVIWKL